jgi:pimeloyl-ACP methyl ester carboxylesterase
MNRLDLASLPNRAAAEKAFERDVPDWAMRKFLATNLDLVEGRWRWLINLPVITGALSHLEKNVLSPAERYEGPALFVIGGQSRYVKPEDHARIRAHFPSARIETIAESGHNPHMETREAFVRILSDLT